MKLVGDAKTFDVFENHYGVRKIEPEKIPDVFGEMEEYIEMYEGTPLSKMPFRTMLEFEQMLMKTNIETMNAFLAKYPKFERFRKTVTDVLNYKEQLHQYETIVSKINSMKILMADCFKDFANRIDDRLDDIENKLN